LAASLQMARTSLGTLLKTAWEKAIEHPCFWVRAKSSPSIFLGSVSPFAGPASLSPSRCGDCLSFHDVFLWGQGFYDLTLAWAHCLQMCPRDSQGEVDSGENCEHADHHYLLLFIIKVVKGWWSGSSGRAPA
jgi:hypothetical protein